MSAPQDFPDFAQGVAILDQATSFFGNTQQQVNPNSGFTVDTSRAASMTIVLLPPFSGGNHANALLLEWSEAGIPMGWDVLSFHNATSWSGQGWSQLGWQVPCRGSSVAATLRSNDSTWTGAYVILSTRAIPAPVVTAGNQPSGRLLVSYSTAAPASGTTAVQYVPPVTRAVSIATSYAITNGNLNVNGIYADSAGTMHSLRIWNQAYAGSGIFIPELVAPFIGLEVAVTNNDTSAHSGSIQIWDVS